jgi:hypothetical protein
MIWIAGPSFAATVSVSAGVVVFPGACADLTIVYSAAIAFQCGLERFGAI